MANVLVAGGASGIGAAAVRGFLDRGDTVLLVDRDEALGSAVVADHTGGHFLVADLADPASISRAVEASAELANGVIDTVFYNAGVLEAHDLADWSVEAWNRSIAVNLTGPFLIAQATAPHLALSDQGRLLITASTGALRGHAGMPAYHATKSGVLGLVRSLADELGASGTTVNAICPGWIDTPFNDAFWDHQPDRAAAIRELERSIPLGRQGTPDDLTELILFLASPGSAYITGQSIVIDGGYTAV